MIMKFNLKKKNLKQLNRNVNDLEKQQTPQVAGGVLTDFACLPTGHICHRLSKDGHNSCLC
jgi:hypothetical protein